MKKKTIRRNTYLVDFLVCKVFALLIWWVNFLSVASTFFLNTFFSLSPYKNRTMFNKAAEFLGISLSSLNKFTVIYAKSMFQCQ